MPFSQSSQLSAIVEFIEKEIPTSILDVGVGMGQYGFLARINLEGVNLFRVNDKDASQTPKHEWRVRIDGIEAFRTYLTPVHDYVYNKIMIGDALEILPTIREHAYELVLAIDILEHFAKPDGVRFLDHVKRIASRAVLVSTPKEVLGQEVEANPYESHRSQWSQEELAEQGFAATLENRISWISVYRHRGYKCHEPQ
jgi:2-polyprenyl-3-methyl-5-hydroxy-6-metoxy-1,4-benzoquinol methylase